ncbi:cell wall-binding repeat-containing protein [Mobiluncus curtisii]|uniref:Cell wall-binding repeat 2 family protein n=1 Tax=Mobiluncus curtisii TaxID=2051 RepID=A0A7Y0UHV9_9ACTO|nr:cell wall-binding repeat-containing protein [Mobiluncus curtisii]MCU9987591.1 cell wall-binding repeat 2 family protein [Mobiluncus curtisii]MCV0000727.1 cell wall-binding repeat 2 family protein [Mobiluncus curtisii]NMW48552.1 cell wall-binding repeat 2 family protein [Mobiluncus curtisii]NMW87647.1 cell wall-binding repeat 2 family protein [Mobiluncus curtisii]NMX13175.1 cell wall-binding repeat 2 family protein [Mobiluncus curtisii]
MKKSVLTFGAAAAALAMTVPMSAVAATDSDRYAGADRYNTAISVASAFGTSDVVYLSRGDSQADAVAGGKLPSGPLLLVNDSPSVQKNVAEAITKLKATKVVVLGGTGAVSDATVKAVAGKATVTRIAGADRFGTAAEISKNLFPEGKTSAKVYLANGITLVDALVGGTMTDGAPVLLTNGSGTLPAATLNEIKRLKPSEVVALGGEGAVLPAELNAAATANGAGGGSGMTKEQAKAKLQADLDKAAREADMKLDGWYTLADGKTAKDFVKSNVNNSGVEKTIELTAPRVLKSEVKTAGNDKILKSDTKTGAVAPADAPAQQTEKDAKGKLVATYVGIKNVKTKEDLKKDFDTAKAAYEADKTNNAKKEAYDKAQAAYDAAPLQAEKDVLVAQAKLEKKKADDARTAGPTDAAIQAYLGGAGAKASRIAGADRYLTALEIAKTQYPNGTNAKALYFANGMASADATVAGFIDNKAELAGPVLLVQKDSAPAEVTAFAKAARTANAALAGKFKALGGVGVISDSLVDQFKDLLK